MLFSLKSDRITKKELLTHRTEEEYMSFYLGIIPDNTVHNNPLRRDRKPSASFYRAKDGQLIFRDWALDWRLNFVDVVMKKFNVNFDKALKIIGNDFGIISKPHYTKNSAAVKYEGQKLQNTSNTLLQGEVIPFNKSDLDWWLSFGITEATLKKYDVHNLKSIFLNGYPSFFASKKEPIYGYYFGKEDGRELWKMYMPARLSFRFLLNTNKVQGFKQLPKEGEILVVTKSLKDVMVLHEMGIPAIATQGETVLLTEAQYRALAKRFKRIVFNGDFDPTGVAFMANSRRKYPGIPLTFTDRKKYAKDLSDYVKKVGFAKAERLCCHFKRAIIEGKFDKHLDKVVKKA